MDSFPLNAVENKCEERPQDKKVHSNYGKHNIRILVNILNEIFSKTLNKTKLFAVKSPIKLTMTEKRVIGGLKNLTELLFKQNYKQNETVTESTENSDPLQPDEISTNSEVPSASDINTDKENSENFQRFLDDAMKDGAEKFCAMVVQQLTTQTHIEHNEEWHRGQLNAYNLAHERLFDEDE